ncbi:hypothetical protein FB567DRAFT_191686 [Paraphoma chrysanthemicola]|uniref:Uncharacterized protein n=1 Tax=Paraphoma chrysanthemicola TaxID=798071 RepID=A0A8K0VU77_9PLEO|nr:hypothetical protein FB567DRAFT_191686 [Paraphoma chrysanthemicola]
MSLTRPTWASVLLLSFCTFSEAWVLHRKPAGHAQIVKDAAPIELRNDAAPVVSLEKRQDSELFCPDDRWQEFLNSNPENRVKTFCNEWLGISPATTVLEYTPTITVTTSAATVTTFTSTTRILTSSTTTVTATTTLAARLPRAANIAAVAEDIINSVIESGTTSEAVATKNEQRIQAESGLANACSCKMVEPTATVTSSYAVPPVVSSITHRQVNYLTLLVHYRRLPGNQFLQDH